MDVRTLRYFLAVAREGSITRTAEVLHISQPALSRQLIDLEQELGKQLLIRDKRKIALTEDGLLLRRRAQEIVELMDRTEAEMTGSNERITGTVHIGAGEARAVQIAADAAEQLHEAFPQIRFRFSTGVAGEIMEMLSSGLLDFGIVSSTANIQDYDYLELPALDRWVLVMRKDSSLARLETISPQDIGQIPLICSWHMLIRNELSGWLGKDLSELNVVATCDMVHNASLLIRAGMGYMFTFEVFHLNDDALCCRPLNPPMQAKMVLIWKKHQTLSRASQKFLESIKKRL